MLKMVAERVKDEEESNDVMELKGSFVGVGVQEIKFVNLLKLILDGGWCIDGRSYQDILALSGAENQILELAQHFVDHQDMVLVALPNPLAQLPSNTSAPESIVLEKSKIIGDLQKLVLHDEDPLDVGSGVHSIDNKKILASMLPLSCSCTEPTSSKKLYQQRKNLLQLVLYFANESDIEF